MKKLIEQAIKKRGSLRKVTNAIRLVNGKGDDLDGLVLEQYNQHFSAQIFRSSWLNAKEKNILIDIVKNDLKGKYFIVKNRTQSADASIDKNNMEIWIDSAQSSTIVTENGIKFSVDLSDTLNSGLFLDMRCNRKLVGGMSKGSKVLNCFSYTCSFGVYCRMAGAESVVNVDTSKKILGRGSVNYELNGIVPLKNEFIVSDTLKYLRTAEKKNNTFDMIILDPPSFSRMGEKSFSIAKDMQELIGLSIAVLNPNGILFASTNYSRMNCSDIEKMMRLQAGVRKIEMCRHLGQDIDFTGSGLRPDSHLAAVIAKVQ